MLIGEGNGTPLQYSCLENPVDGGAWQAAIHGVAESLTQLRDFAFTFHFHALKKDMATHSSVLAWRIPEIGEPGGLQSMGLHRVGHDRSDLTAAAAAACMLIKVKDENEKAGLKLNIQKMKIMASSPITSQQIDGETMETVTDFIFLGSKITADGDGSHEIKRHLLLWKKSYNKYRQHIKKQKYYFANKNLHSQIYGFSSSHVWMWQLDHKWNKAECQRIDAFELWCSTFLRVPWTARRSSQSFLKEISPEYSLEGLMLKLKLQYFGHLM